MPSGKNRHRLEISEERYQQLAAMAAREGYSVTLFADKLLALAMTEYVNARREQRYPFAERIKGVMQGFCRRG